MNTRHPYDPFSIESFILDAAAVLMIGCAILCFQVSWWFAIGFAIIPLLTVAALLVVDWNDWYD